MKQSKLESHLESSANIASGFIISYMVWIFVVRPLISVDLLNLNDAFIITSIFTVTSYIRSYIWRRFFNAGLHRKIKKLSRFLTNKRILSK